MIIIVSFVPWNTATTIGIRIPNVPHDVPVANARKHPTRKIIAGRKFNNPPAADCITLATYSAAPSLSVIAFNVHANVIIMIAVTISLNPSGTHSIDSRNLSTFLSA